MKLVLHCKGIIFLLFLFMPIILQAQADLVIIETASPSISPGRNLTMTILIVNNGSGAALNVSLFSSQPVGTTFVSVVAPEGWNMLPVDVFGTVRASIQSLAAGVIQKFTVVVNVPTNITPGILTASVSLTSTSIDLNPGDNQAFSTTTIIFPIPTFDLIVIARGLPTAYNTGGRLVYTFQVINNAVGPCFSVSLVDALPSGTTFASLSAPDGWIVNTPAVGAHGIITATNPILMPGSVAEFTLILNLPPGFAALVPSIFNAVSVTSATPDVTPTSNLATFSTRIISPLPANLSVIMYGPTSVVTAGSLITLTIIPGNLGPNTAQNVTVTEILQGLTFVSLTTTPGWTASAPPVGGSGGVVFSSPSFEAGGVSPTFTLVVKVPENTPANTQINNSVFIAGNNLDPDNSNNSSGVSFPVLSLPCVLVCPANIVVPNDAGRCGAIVNYPIPATSGNCGIISTVPASGSLFPIGTTTVRVTAGSGLTCSFTVTVNDTQAPTISLCPTVPALCGNNSSTYTIPKLVATDNCGFPLISYEISGATSRTGTGSDASGTFNAGTNIIKWTVKDAGNNMATCETKVTINSAINVAIPDASALGSGVNLNTVYPGYAPASTITLSAEAGGGVQPYTYAWSNTASTASVNVSPTALTGYRVKVRDASGCTQESAEKIIEAVDVSCGTKENKVQVCIVPPGNFSNTYNGCVEASAVATLIKAGSRLGNCNNPEDFSLSLKATPNPTYSYFMLNISSSNMMDNIVLKIYTVTGILLETRKVTANSKIQLGDFYPIGIYFAEAVQGTKKATLALVKIK